MKRERTVEHIEAGGLMPVLRAPSAELAVRAARALSAGGVSVVEVTMTVPDALSVLERLRGELDSGIVLGAGTVVDPASVGPCIDAGADFVVSPGFDPAVVRAAHDRDRAVMPGALTPTEVIAAWQSGADMVKVFPCSAMGGASYLRALRAPLPDVKLMPTGGVDLTTLDDYVSAGAVALGVGSALVDLKLLEREGESALAAHAGRYVNAVSAARTRRDEG